MIENCPDILLCEKKLASRVQKVSLLGEIILSYEEIDKLGILIGEEILKYQLGIERLKTKIRS